MTSKGTPGTREKNYKINLIFIPRKYWTKIRFDSLQMKKKHSETNYVLYIYETFYTCHQLRILNWTLGRLEGFVVSSIHYKLSII